MSGWYPRPDSNRHASQREILNLLRLPFRHLGTFDDVARAQTVSKPKTRDNMCDSKI